MKKLLFILFLIPMMGFGQTMTTIPNEVIDKNIFHQWENYLIDCNELVPDTIKQDGVVNVKYKPVVVNGDISHYLLTPIDTVWTDCKCKEYKNVVNFILNTRNESIFDNYVLTGSLEEYTHIEQINNKINIVRNKICHIKKRKANWYDFWNRWLVKQKIIEQN